MKITPLLASRLADLGVQRPSPALLDALEVHLSPRIATLITRTITKRVVAQTFASTLLDVNQGSPEGSASAPHLASSNEAIKPSCVAGATNTETV